ncbi:hypothetical protein OPT61_g3881 [Boeremia exigua]|uniref:Uncharacterized protein n=1 Tax=Boeremia exigua TaxID=749465 RepID=A0ACC2IGE1_9PLEO|nr:hypothetical protein OPT61_g3881 [Boeremia exigua]
MHALTLLPLLFGLPCLSALVSRQFPHLIIPVDANAPDRAYGTQLTGAITQQVTTPTTIRHPPTLTHPEIHRNLLRRALQRRLLVPAKLLHQHQQHQRRALETLGPGALPVQRVVAPADYQQRQRHVEQQAATHLDVGDRHAGVFGQCEYHWRSCLSLSKGAGGAVFAASGE